MEGLRREVKPGGFGGASRANGDMQRSFWEVVLVIARFFIFFPSRGKVTVGAVRLRLLQIETEWSCQLWKEQLRLAFLRYFGPWGARPHVLLIIEADGWFSDGHRANVGQREMKATLAMKNSDSDPGLLVRWSLEWRWGVMRVADASVMAVLNARIYYADCWDLKVSLISESTSTSVLHQFCWVSLIFRDCLHLLLNTRPTVEEILLPCLLSSPDPRGGKTFVSSSTLCGSSQHRKVGDRSSFQFLLHLPKPPPPPQASDQTLATTILIFRSPCRSRDSGVVIVVEIASCCGTIRPQTWKKKLITAQGPNVADD